MPEHRQIQIATPSMEYGRGRMAGLKGADRELIVDPRAKSPAFEKAFAARHGVKHAIALTSATIGLHLALTALDKGPGNEMIVPAFT